MRRPRGQSAYLRGRPAHSMLKRAELSETTGGVARQVAGCMEEEGPSQGGDASSTGREPDRRAPIRGEKRPRCRACGHGLNSTHS